MIELVNDQLKFTFPEVHPQASLSIAFQRTLRIPDDSNTYRLPPGLGRFPLRHVDDYGNRVPSSWVQHGGIMMPMYQAEALWLQFNTPLVANRSSYPFAIKIATGKQCAVSGQPWQPELVRSPQNYLIAPRQPWLDGYVVKKGVVRQFVAMPLGSGYTAEEQVTGEAEHGGLQIAVVPMKREVFERRFPERVQRQFRSGARRMRKSAPAPAASAAMGLGTRWPNEARSLLRSFDADDWQIGTNSRCFVHLCNSLVWSSITGQAPPHPAPTAKSYTDAGLPGSITTMKPAPASMPVPHSETCPVSLS